MTKINFISLGAEPIAGTLCQWMAGIYENGTSLSVENTILVLADSYQDKWGKISVKEDGTILHNKKELFNMFHVRFAVVYFRMTPENDSIHPLAFLSKTPGVKSLVIDFRDHFNFRDDDDTTIISAIKAWLKEAVCPREDIGDAG